MYRVFMKDGYLMVEKRSVRPSDQKWSIYLVIYLMQMKFKEIF